MNHANAKCGCAGRGLLLVALVATGCEGHGTSIAATQRVLVKMGKKTYFIDVRSGSRCELPEGKACSGWKVVKLSKHGRFHPHVGCIHEVKSWYRCPDRCKMANGRVTQACDPKGRACDDLRECTVNDIHDGHWCSGKTIECSTLPCPDTHCNFTTAAHGRLVEGLKPSGAVGKYVEDEIYLFVYPGTERMQVWDLAHRLGGTLIGQLPRLRWYLVGGLGVGAENLRKQIEVAKKEPFVEGASMVWTADVH